VPGRLPSTPTVLAVLFLLSEKPRHAYEIAVTIRHRRPRAGELKLGTLYGTVDALARAGCIRPLETSRQGRRPHRTVYAITEVGRAELAGLLREALQRPDTDPGRFAMGLTFCAALPVEEVTEQLERRVALLDEEVRAARAALCAERPEPAPPGAQAPAHQPGGPQTPGDRLPAAWRLSRLGEEYELAVREAELDWVRGLAARMRARAAVTSGSGPARRAASSLGRPSP
jgi:DNA-binding PadR family transcriptional regulator